MGDGRWEEREGTKKEERRRIKNLVRRGRVGVGKNKDGRRKYGKDGDGRRTGRRERR